MRCDHRYISRASKLKCTFLSIRHLKGMLGGVWLFGRLGTVSFENGHDAMGPVDILWKTLTMCRLSLDEASSLDYFCMVTEFHDC